MKTVLLAINSKYVHTALGLRYISEYCKKKGVLVELLEETIQTPLLAVLAELTALKPDVVGLSVHIWNKVYVYNLIELLRKVCPQVKIIVGGPEVAFAPERIFTERPEIDYIVQGEGERCVPELLQALAMKGNIPDHIAYRDIQGTIIHNKGVTVIEDLGELEFPYPDLKEVVTAKKIVYYECTRGCPFTCSYCLSGISKAVRKRPLKKVLADLDLFLAAGVPLVKFVDRTYNLDEEYFLPIMKYLSQADTTATFHFEIKVDLLSPKILEFLKTVPKGRFQFEVGVQSTNERTLEAICRQDNWEKLVANVQQIKAYDNIHLHLDLIAGLPYEGINEFIKSFNDVYSLRPQMLQLGFLKILQGTVMQIQQAEHEILYMEQPPYEVVATKYLAYHDLRFLKVLEDVFDHTYNTGRFPQTLEYLLKLDGGNAFAFYSKLTTWWEEKGLYPLSHNARGVAKLLYDFATAYYEEQQDIVLEVLRFDVFCKQPSWQPDWLQWHLSEINDQVMNFWREKDLVKKYLPNYEFYSWRQIRKNNPIEIFAYDPYNQEKGVVAYMADYNSKETQISRINREDFFVNK